MRYEKLKPGEDTADTIQPKKRKDGKYQGVFTLCLPNGKPIKVKVVATTVGQWRKKAREKVEERLRDEERTGDWSESDSITQYIRSVSRNAIASAQLAPRSKTKYFDLLNYIMEEFEGYNIREAVRFRNLEKALKNIAQEHGSESARQARNVLSKYVLQQLIRDELIAGNPLLGMSIDLGNHKKTNKAKGGKALTEAEHKKVLDYLLALDPTKTKAPKRGKYTLEHAINRRRNAIELTLLQATTGLRISEALGLRLADIDDDGQRIIITVSDERSKTNRGREIPVMKDERVRERIRGRISNSSGEFLFPAPATPTNTWNISNAHKALRSLFNEIARECSIPLLNEVSSHVWRSTLNTIAMQKGLPAEMRAAYFGHDREINKTAYTDTTDVTPLVEKMG